MNVNGVNSDGRRRRKMQGFVVMSIGFIGIVIIGEMWLWLRRMLRHLPLQILQKGCAMPRKAGIADMKEINKWRELNYVSHFECRRFALDCDHAIVQRTASALESLPRPELNVFGAVPMVYYTHEVQRNCFLIGKMMGLDAGGLLWWYWSELGWNAFQDFWKSLPDLYTAPVDNSTVVHMLAVREAVFVPRR